MIEMIKRVLLRFVRVFVGGMLAYLVATAPTLLLKDWNDWGAYVPGLLWSAVTAGLVALDKWYREASR
jgi:hypothetical protein